jgi:hypothetical protein
METCYQVGKSGEQRFATHLSQPRFATDKQDMEEHWDVESEGKRYDVKAMKKWRRSDAEPTDRIHYVELRNVRGELGWIYGEADYIAFETRSHWIVVPRKKLVFFIEGATEKNERSDKPAVYKLYQREGRKDLMTVVPTMDLLAISEVIINKLKIQ